MESVMKQFTWTTYLSVLTYRYGSVAMRELWSELTKETMRRKIWCAWAEVLSEIGLVTEAELADLTSKCNAVDVDHIQLIEVAETIDALTGNVRKATRHDVQAAIAAYAEQCPVGGRVIHLAMTSEESTSNLDIMRMRSGLQMLIDKLRAVLANFSLIGRKYANLPCAGWTHIQAATPTTYGHRLMERAQVFLEELDDMERLLATRLKPKGLKGATGSRNSYIELISGTGANMDDLEAKFLAKLELPAAYMVTGQTPPRDQELELLQVLSRFAATIHKFALDMRILMSSPFSEIGEPGSQGGSSAMPWKINPIHWENMGSLARMVEAYSHVAWMNAGMTVLERSLDDSADRRIFIPEAFLICDELLSRLDRMTRNLIIREDVTAANLRNMGNFLGLEGLLMVLVRDSGLERERAHHLIRQAALDALDGRVITSEAASDKLVQNLVANLTPVIGIVKAAQISEIVSRGATNTGDAPVRAIQVVEQIERALTPSA
jgi:adenylosuccinate lyase